LQETIFARNKKKVFEHIGEKTFFTRITKVCAYLQLERNSRRYLTRKEHFYNINANVGDWYGNKKRKHIQCRRTAVN